MILKNRRDTRLHGKPKIYYSSYTDGEIKSFSKLLAPGSWCVFDNTASGAAIENALTCLNAHNHCNSEKMPGPCQRTDR